MVAMCLHFFKMWQLILSELYVPIAQVSQIKHCKEIALLFVRKAQCIMFLTELIKNDARII